MSPQGHTQISLRGSSYGSSVQQKVYWALPGTWQREPASVGTGEAGRSSWAGHPSWECSTGSALQLGAQGRAESEKRLGALAYPGL